MTTQVTTLPFDLGKFGQGTVITSEAGVTVYVDPDGEVEFTAPDPTRMSHAEAADLCRTVLAAVEAVGS